MSRYMRHPIDKTGRGISGNDVADGVFPRQIVGGGHFFDKVVVCPLLKALLQYTMDLPAVFTLITFLTMII